MVGIVKGATTYGSCLHFFNLGLKIFLKMQAHLFDKIENLDHFTPDTVIIFLTKVREETS